jgi:hypothetical protein
MGQLRERNTGSVVNVPDEDEAAVLALGYYEQVKDKKESAKKSTAKKSSK